MILISWLSLFLIAYQSNIKKFSLETKSEAKMLVRADVDKKKTWLGNPKTLFPRQKWFFRGLWGTQGSGRPKKSTKTVREL